MSNTKLLIASYRKTMRDLQKEYDKSEETLTELCSRADNLTSEEIKTLMIHQLLFKEDYNRIAKRFNKTLTMGVEAKEVRDELKLFINRIRAHISQIAGVLKKYDLSAEEFTNFLKTKSKTK